jgi:superfamily II DNA/RNA helicase
LIIFTESKETADYLGKELDAIYGDSVVVFNGSGSSALKHQIELSYNPKFSDKGEDKYNILITTDVLAEGVNLHRSGVLVNYDLPWNPTRIMQRVGRINRIGTDFGRIYVFNFFPTAQTDKHLSLKDRITEKLQAFHDTLGEDFKYLSDDEQVTSHKLYADLTAEMDNEESGNPELFYLNEIRRIRDEDTELFDKIKRLPRKSRSGKRSSVVLGTATVTFLRKGYLKMFFKTEGDETSGVTFIEAIKLIQSVPNDKRIPIGTEFFNHLGSNKAAFDDKLVEEEIADFDSVTVTGNDAKVIKLLKALSKCKKLTDPQEEAIRQMIDLWTGGEIPSNITKDVLKIPKKETDELQLFAEIYDRIPDRYFTGRNKKREVMIGVKQVILSCWLQNGEE